MKSPSIPSALVLSMLAALVLTTSVMRPIDIARAAETAARCAGYEQLTFLLGNSHHVQRFSMRRCMDMIGRN